MKWNSKKWIQDDELLNDDKVKLKWNKKDAFKKDAWCLNIAWSLKMMHWIECLDVQMFRYFDSGCACWNRFYNVQSIHSFNYTFYKTVTSSTSTSSNGILFLMWKLIVPKLIVSKLVIWAIVILCFVIWFVIVIQQFSIIRFCFMDKRISKNKIIIIIIFLFQ